MNGEPTDPAMSSPDGRYVYEKVLGEGGGGSVHLARDRRTGQQVAIKRCHTDLLEEASREAAILSGISFPGVVDLLDVTLDSSGAFLAIFEYVRGENLYQATEQSSLVEITPFLADILRAMQFVHRRGIVHRDLKPENILVKEQVQGGVATLLDFGLAAPASSSSAGLSGTLAYLAPEIIEGAAPDARSDLYAFGVVLYQLLARRLPSHGLSGVDVMRLHTSGDLALPPEVEKQLPVGVGDIVRTLLRRDPGLRPGSASEVLDAMSRALEVPIPLETRETLVGRISSADFGVTADLTEELIHHGSDGGGLALTLPAGSETWLNALRIGWAARGRPVVHLELGDGKDLPDWEGTADSAPAGAVVLLSCSGILDSREDDFVSRLLEEWNRRTDELAIIVATEDGRPLPSSLARFALARLDVPRPDMTHILARVKEALGVDLPPPLLGELRVSADFSPRSVKQGLGALVEGGVLMPGSERPFWNREKLLERVGGTDQNDRVQGLLSGLSETQITLLGAISLARISVPRTLTARLSSDGTETLDEDLSALISQGLVQADAEGLSPVSRIVAKVVSASLDAAQVKKLAGLLADLILEDTQDDPERIGEAGLLLVQADRPTEGQKELLDAGILLRSQGRPAEARRYLTRCLELVPEDKDPVFRVRALRWLADCDSLDGRNEEATHSLETAISLKGDVEDLARCYGILARTRTREGLFREAEDAIRMGMGLNGVSSPTRALLLTTQSMLRMSQKDVDGACRSATEALEEAGEEPSLEKGAALMTLGNAQASLGRVSEAINAYQRAQALGPEVGRDDMTALATANLGRLLFESGRFNEAIQSLEPIIDRFEKTGSLRHAENIFQILILARLGIGDVSAARSLVHQGRSLFGEHASKRNRSLFLIAAGVVELRAGNVGEADRLLTETVEIRRELAAPGPLSIGLSALAEVQTWMGESEKAAETVAEACRLARKGDDQEALVGALIAAGTLRFLTSRPHSALVLARHCVRIANSMSPPKEVPRATVLLMRVLLERGLNDEVIQTANDVAKQYGDNSEDASLRVVAALRLEALAKEEAAKQARSDLLDQIDQISSKLGGEGLTFERGIVLETLARVGKNEFLKSSGDSTRSASQQAATLLSRATMAIRGARSLFEALGHRLESDRITDIEREFESEEGVLPGEDRDLTGLDRHIRSMERLLEVNKAINSELDPRRLLSLILDEAISLCGARRGFVILVQGAGIEVTLARNFAEQNIQNPEFQFSHSVARQVAESGEPVRTSNALHDPLLRSIASIAELRVTSIICVSLRARDQILGSIYLDHPDVVDRFDDSHLEVLTDFAGAAGIALERARLYQENRERADDLSQAKQEIERLNDELVKTVEAQARDLDETKGELEQERRGSALRYDYRSIITRSPNMEEMLRLLDRITEIDLPVVIQGESGTGKELVARAIHYNGPRSAKKFVSVNCAAMAEQLIEAELFGYVKGAFTGAERDRKGMFELADGGSLFLDEIGDMSLEVQKRLLRVVQYGDFYRLGGKDKVQVDVRIICATNKDLKQLISDGTFREDLFFRLNVAPVVLPPLRDRQGDVIPLIQHVMASIEQSGLLKGRKFSGAALEAMENYSWPGNVRELENEVKRLLLLESDRMEVEFHDLPSAMQDANALMADSERTLKDQLVEYERHLVKGMLAECGGNKAEAARRLGVSPRGFYKILDRVGLSSGAAQRHPSPSEEKGSRIQGK